jgi:hypothetical protein
MKGKGLLASVVLLAVLAGLVWWSNHDQAAKSKSAADAGVIKLLAIPIDQFVEVRIKKLTGEVVAVKRENNKWRLTQPVSLPADLDAIGTMVSTIGNLIADQVVEEKATDLKGFGLDIPTLDVEVILKDGKVSRVLIGNDTLNGAGAYAMLPGNAKVFTVAAMVKATLDKRPDDIRDKHFLNFESDKLTAIEVLLKTPAIEFGRSADKSWQVVKPRVLRADGSVVDNLITKLKDAKFDTTGENAAKLFAAAPKLATVTLTDAAGSQTLEVHRDKDKNVYAKSSAVDGVFQASSELAELLEKGVEEYRNKKLLDFGYSDPSIVEVQGVTYSKAGETWMANGKSLDNNSVQAMIDKLRDIAASKFGEKGGGEPIFTARVVSNKGARQEKVVISKLGNEYLAQREGEPTVYEMDQHAVEDLQKAVAGVKEAKPEAPKKK